MYFVPVILSTPPRGFKDASSHCACRLLFSMLPHRAGMMIKRASENSTGLMSYQRRSFFLDDRPSDFCKLYFLGLEKHDFNKFCQYFFCSSRAENFWKSLLCYSY